MEGPVSSKLNRYFLLSCLLGYSFLFAACSKAPAPKGVYLLNASEGVVVLQSDRSGLKVVDSSYDTRWKVSVKGSVLKISREWEDLPAREVMELVPSKTIAGDWDLVKVSDSLSKSRARAPRLKEKLPSYLHKLDDPRVVEYFKAAPGRTLYDVLPGQSERLLELASGIVGDHPNDPYARVFQLDALLRAGQVDPVQSQYAEWRRNWGEFAGPLLEAVAQNVEWSNHALRLSEENRNAFDFANRWILKQGNLRANLEVLPGILEYEEFAYPMFPVGFVIPNYLEFQVAAKTFHVEAVFLMMQGEREKALQVASSIYRLGQLMNENPPLINRLIGIAIRNMSCETLELYALNACESPDEIARLWKSLEFLESKQREPSPEEFLALLYVPDALMIKTRETVMRQRAADARFENVRMAAAARHRLLSDGKLPGSAQDFAPLLAEGLPKDPFVPEPMRFLSGGESIVCYSVGPDEQDDGARIEYDPTNGSISRGDISLRVPREREFPFPRDGVRVVSARDLRRQFPNGLPADRFGSRRPTEQSLGISDTFPVYIYSRGPDLDVDTGDELRRFIPKFHYDSTNGTISNGDLFFEVP